MKIAFMGAGSTIFAKMPNDMPVVSASAAYHISVIVDKRIYRWENIGAELKNNLLSFRRG